MTDEEPKPKINTIKQLEQITRAADKPSPKKDEVLERIKKRLQESANS